MKEKLLILFIASLVSFNFVACRTQPEFTREQMSSTTSTAFAEMWMLSDVEIPIVTGAIWNSSLTALFPGEECVVFLGKQLTDKYYSLQCLDTMTGHVRWQSALTTDAIAAVTRNSDFVFVVFSQGSVFNCPEPECDTIKIAAFEIETGNVKWSEIYHGLGAISQIIAEDEVVHVRGGGGHGAWATAFSFVADTGERLSDRGPWPAIGRVDSHKYYDLPHSFFEGEVVIVSNVVKDNGIIYYLTNNAILWAFAEDTKEILGQVYFKPNEPRLVTADRYFITAREEVVVYLGGSGQLFAFAFSPNEQNGD